MKRKKLGSSLIVVIIVIMFLTTVSMAMLSMIAGNYKARVAEGKRIENLYASDSGLDVAYNIIGKTFDAATQYGYYNVQAMKSTEGNRNSANNTNAYKNLENDIKLLKGEIKTLESTEPTDDTPQSKINNEIEQKNNLIAESKDLEQLLINEEFKRAFKNFIAQSLETGESDATHDKLADSIKNHKFITVSLDDSNEISFTDNTIDFGINNGTAPTLALKYIKPPETVDASQTSQNIGINGPTDGHCESVHFNITPDEKYADIKVSSNFYSEKFNQNDADVNKTNERELEESFEMVIPNFKDIYYQQAGGAMKEYLATQDRAITVCGNMNVHEADDFKVNGEIFVGGSPTTPVVTSNRSYEKYNGGIMIAGSDRVNFNGDVVTRNSFNIRDGANVSLTKNLYGRNVYLGGKYYEGEDIFVGLDEIATNSNLYVNSGDPKDETKGQIVIDNDLALKSEGSNIKIKDFYGVNDKNISSTDAKGNLVDKVKSSSSIIVNASDNSSIKIENSAYIMGTAHINTNEKDNDTSNQYQTGESGAVKGNYIAYSVPLNEAEGFGYYDPLQLFDEVKNKETGKFEPANVIDKANHFTDYWNGDKNQGHTPDTGGIIWPIDPTNIHSAGAIVYQIGDKIQAIGSSYNLDLEKKGHEVYNKQEEFAKKVYRFNQAATKEYDYDKTELTEFSSIVNTSNIASTGYNLADENGKGEYAIFNGDSSKKVIIQKSDDEKDKIDHDLAGNIIIKVGNKKTEADPDYTLKAVIVTAGNLSIDADTKDTGITINGCVIVGSDLNIDKENITINYDHGVIERVQANNSEVFDAVFGGYVLPSSSSSSSDSASGNVDSTYDLSYFIKKKLWKINK